jgi:hypothetical protein
MNNLLITTTTTTAAKCSSIDPSAAWRPEKNRTTTRYNSFLTINR